MALPINIEDLLNKRRVESNRIEFKAGWNPINRTDYILSDELRHRLGQIAIQVQEVINQSIIENKVQLGQILGQIFVQVWSTDDHPHDREN